MSIHYLSLKQELTKTNTIFLTALSKEELGTSILSSSIKRQYLDFTEYFIHINTFTTNSKQQVINNLLLLIVKKVISMVNLN